MPVLGWWLIAGLGCLSACGGGARVNDRDIVGIELDELLRLLERRAGETALVDVRLAGDRATGWIEGSIGIPLPELVAGDARLKEARTIVLHGSGAWDDPLASAGAKRMMALGYRGVVVYRGGVSGWVASGRKLTGSKSEAPPGVVPE